MLRVVNSPKTAAAAEKTSGKLVFENV